jgi:hypothetical protein
MGFSRKVSEFKVSILLDFSVLSFKRLFRQVEVKGASGGANLRG